MALFPCDRHGARYSGKQSTLYLAIGSSTQMDRVRLRLCEPCLDEILEGVDGTFDKTMENGEPMGDYQSSFECVRCNEAGETIAAFVTVYRPGQDQDGWYARLCSADAAEFRAAVVGPEPPTPSESRKKRA